MEKQIICITGASGSGKTTLSEYLFKTYSGSFGTIPSVLTRKPRPGDETNLIYTSKERFDEMFLNGELMWKKENHGNFYALRVSDVKDALLGTKRVLCTISPECIPNLIEFCTQEKINPEQFLFLHVLSPAEDTIRARLATRGDTPESIDRRVAECKYWDEYIRSLPYHIHLLDNSGTPEDFLKKASAIIFAN